MSDDAESGTAIKIGGFDLKGWWVAAALPVLSGLSGAIYYGYDTVTRFASVEESVNAVINVESRVQTLEQAIQDNGVRELAPKLSAISTQMATILEQQKTLLDLRSMVEKSSGITDGIQGQTDKIKADIEDIWKALDDIAKNPIR